MNFHQRRHRLVVLFAVGIVMLLLWPSSLPSAPPVLVWNTSVSSSDGVCQDRLEVPNLNYRYEQYGGSFSREAADAVTETIITGPPRIHVMCASLFENGSAAPLVLWDNPDFPQHRERPFFDALREWWNTSVELRRRHRSRSVCVYLQDDLEGARRQEVEADKNNGGVPILSNLVRPGVNTLPLPDHTFAHWIAGRLEPFDNFYRFAACSSLMPPFASRRDILFWRGQSTGAGAARGNAGSGRRTLVTSIMEQSRRKQQQRKLSTAVDAQFVSVYFNHSASSHFIPLRQHSQFKYLLDLPGYGYSGRLKYLLLLGSVVFVVQHPEVEYWFPFMCPWVHYVPVKRDLSNLFQALRLVEANPEVAERIAAAGRHRALTLFSKGARWNYTSDVMGAYFEGNALRLTSVPVALDDEGGSCLPAELSRSLLFPRLCRLETSPTHHASNGSRILQLLAASERADEEHAHLLPHKQVLDYSVCFAFHHNYNEAHTVVLATYHVGGLVPSRAASAMEWMWHASLCGDGGRVLHGDLLNKEWCVSWRPAEDDYAISQAMGVSMLWL